MNRPNTGLGDWLKKKEHDAFIEDIHRLSALLYFASKPDSELDRDVRIELTEKLLTKLDQRRGHTKRSDVYGYRRWDGRHWRGVEPIRKRLATSMEASCSAP